MNADGVLTFSDGLSATTLATCHLNKSQQQKSFILESVGKG